MMSIPGADPPTPLSARDLARRLVDRYFAETPHPDAPEPEGGPPPAAGEFAYEVRGEIARGGMGVVHEAWDPVLRRPLAMKRVREDAQGDAGRLRRFLREARVTAQLDHPGVVPVHELRLDPEGRPYFTMRLVRGRDLRRAFEAARAGLDGWNVPRAVETLIKVCDTVAFAHSHGVIHRDLKPSNVLVGEFGEVTVLDWGLAKVLGEPDEADAPDDLDEGRTDPARASGAAPGRGSGSGRVEGEPGAETAPGSVLGTPAWMAPEQAAGDAARVGAAADVYAVGSMLYLLLAGEPPYAAPEGTSSPEAVIAALRRGPPPPVRARAGSASSRLVAICERAMARDPASRHPDMAALAADLRGVLAAEEEAREEAERARLEARRARAVSAFLIELFTAADPGTRRGEELTAREILDRGAERLARDLRDQPIVRADLMSAIGTIDYELGRFDRARALHEEALALRRSTGDEGIEAADGISALSVIALAQGRIEEAERLGRELLEVARRHAGERSEATAKGLNNLGVILQNQGRFREAEPLFLEARAVHDSLPAGSAELGANIDNNLGALCTNEGRPAEAAKWYRRALERNLALRGPEHPEIAIHLNNLASALAALGETAEAERCFRDALAMRRKLLGDEHPKIATSLNSLGAFLRRSGRLDEAEAMLREALALHARTRGEEHPACASALQNLAEAVLDGGRLAEAEELARRADAIRRRALPPGHPDLAKGLRTLASVLATRGDLGSAAAALDEAIGIWSAAGLGEHVQCRAAVAERSRLG